MLLDNRISRIRDGIKAILQCHPQTALATMAPHSDIITTMNPGHKATIKRGGSSSSLSQSKGIASSAGGKMVDRWIKGFDARQANFDSRHNALLDKLGAHRSAESDYFRKK